MNRLIQTLLTTALALATGLTACSRQDSVFSAGSLAKPPTTVTAEAQTKFEIINSGQTSSSIIALRVSGGHLPKVLSIQLDAPFSWKGSGSFPGVGGTCDRNGLVDQCLLAIEFTPTAPGSFSKSLRLTYESYPGSITTWSTTLIAETLAVVSFPSSMTSFDLGTFYVGQPPLPQKLTLQHVQGGTASDFRVESGPAKVCFEGAGDCLGTFPGTSGTCRSTLSSGSCTLSMYLTGTSTSTISQPLTVSYFDGKQRQSISIPTVGAIRNPPVLGLSLVKANPADPDIGTVYLGGSRDIPLKVAYVRGDVAATGLVLLGLSGELSFSGGNFPGTLDPSKCQTSISSGNCDLKITVTPTVEGTRTRTLELQYYSGSLWIPSTAEVKYTVIKPASLSASPSLASFPVTAVNSTNWQLVTLTNNSLDTAATGISANFPNGFQFRNGTYPGTGGSCTSVLNPGSSCTIAVEFVPTTHGSFSGDLTLSYQSGLANTPLKISLSGKSQAKLSLTASAPTPTGPVLVGLNSSTTITVTHQGGESATSLTPVLSNTTDFSITNNTCPSTLTSGSCTFSVRFAPQSAATLSTQVQVGFQNGVASDSISTNLSGIGKDPATLLSSVNPLSFGSVVIGTTATRSLTLSVPASAGISASTVAASTSTPFAVTTQCSPNSIAAGGNCVIQVSATAAATGAISRTLTVSYNNGVSSQTLSIPVQMTGVTPASLSFVSSPSGDFGTVLAQAVSSSKTLTIQNTGQTEATDLLAAALPTGFRFNGGTCGSTLGAAQTCTMILEFAPAINSTYSGNFSLSYQSGLPTTAPLTLALSGRTEAKLSLTSSSAFFADTADGGNSTITITVLHTGGASAGSFAVSTSGAPFSISGNTCTGTLASSGTCTLTVRFAPTTNTGSFSTAVNLQFNNGLATETITSGTLTGTAVRRASLTSSVPSLDFGSVLQGLPSSALSVQISVPSNSGVNATSITPTVASPFSISQNTCSTTQGPNSNCTISVRATPTTIGAASGNLAITYFDGASNQTLTIPLQVTGQKPALLVFIPSTVLDFGAISVGSVSTAQLIEIRNDGEVSATNIQSSFFTGYAFSGGSYPGTNGTCPTAPTAALAAGASCQMEVVFSPSQGGDFTNSSGITLSYNNGVTTTSVSRPFSGKSDARLSLSASQNLGSVTVGTSATATITVSHSGFGDVTPLSGSFTSSDFQFYGGTFPGNGGSCGNTLSSGTCTLVVELAPSLTGSRSATLTVNYQGFSGALRSVSMSLLGTGLSPANLQISGIATVSPTVVGSTTNFDLTLTNTGGTAAGSISAANLLLPFKFQGSGSFPGGGTCGAALNANSSCTIKLAYTPTSSGSHSDTLTISYHNGVSPSQSTSQALAGSSGSVASLTASPASLGFGQVIVNQSSTLSFTLQNAALTVPATSISISGLSSPFSVSTNNCSQLTASSSCSISIRYQPTATGIFSQTATISYNNGSTTTTLAVQITGTTPATYHVSPASGLSLGDKTAGVAHLVTYTITRTAGPVSTSLSNSTFTMNSGSGALQYAGGSFPGTDGTCTNPMTVTSCTVVLSVTPTSSGSFSGTWTIDAENGNGTTTLSRNFTGNSVPASYAVSPDDNNAVGNKAAGETHLFTYTITRTGGPSSTALMNSNFISGGAGTLGYAGGSFPGSGGNCGNPMTTSSCTVVLAMNLTGSGAFNGTWSIQAETGAGMTTLSRTLSGNSVPASYLISPDNNTSVGDKATGATHQFTYTISRTGGPSSTAFSNSNFSSSGTGTLSYAGGSFPGTGGSCSNPMTTSTCTVVLAMSLTGLGDFSGTWSIDAATGAGNTTLSRTFTGTAKDRAVLSVSDNTITFRPTSAGQTSQAALLIQNTGSVSFTGLTGSVNSSVASVFRFPGGNFPGQGGTCTASLSSTDPPCTVVIEYAPTDTSVVTGSLQIEAHDGAAVVSRNVTLQQPSFSGGSAKPTLSYPDFSKPRRWAIRDIDGDGYWDQLWLPSTDSQVVIVIGSETQSEIGRISLDEAVPLIRGY